MNPLVTNMTRKLAACASALILCAGCDSATEGSGSGSGQLVVQLTDAPIDNLQSATIWVSRVYLFGNGDSSRHYVVMSTPQQYDLLTLTNGVTVALGTVTIPTGQYNQMRFLVDSARVTLKPGMTFSDGSSSKLMKTPSAQQSGIKVNFSGPVNVTVGQTILVVDFDVSRNFVFTGPKALPTGVLFKPVLHASVRDVAGSISGTVTPLNSRAQVYAIMNGDTVTSALADSVTGTYKLWYLPPGIYSVGVSATGLVSQSAVTPVADGQGVANVNFALIP